MKTEYWIEDANVATLMGCVYQIIVTEVYKNNNIPLPELPELPDDENLKMAFMEDLLSNEEITRPEHINYYMDYRNIIHLMER